MALTTGVMSPVRYLAPLLAVRSFLHLLASLLAGPVGVRLVPVVAGAASVPAELQRAPSGADPGTAA